jgi:hypothetical protein
MTTLIFEIDIEPMNDRMCCMCNGSISSGDFLWRTASGSSLHVCASCVTRGLAMMLETHLRLTQNQKTN